MLCGYDDPAGVLAAMGLTAPGSAAHSHRHLWSHAATMVAVVTSIVGGVGAALAANAAGGGRVPVAACATVGAVVTVISASTFGWHQLRCWRAAEESVPSLFPSQPAPAPCPGSARRRAQSGRQLTPSRPLRASSRRIRGHGGSDQRMASAASVRGCPAHGGRLPGGSLW